ncbi:thiamine phosphate synthase [Robertkochia solimangrovi]|uniref:thiamine phosphate synthase n=1 Tax=Robertkochia solimangrovi TaxID=2213046 RepID=UPI00117E366B|nr:thiamine phosphate synthase [Robertkochia solimangrovi]TRZ41310.1 thiamine phosphate synthase [Robertkochia solimangrovi]
MIAKLHYISQGESSALHLENIGRMLDAGCKWVQLRLKDYPIEIIEDTARAAVKLCRNAGATIIINDHVSIAAKVGADGVHLGSSDTDPKVARKILVSGFIIGGTANTLEDCIRLQLAGVDYIGLGPLRFTTTKKKLSPVLGISGYRKLLQEYRQDGGSLPIIAIGGIIAADLQDLYRAGLHGVAVSGWLTESDFPSERIDQINRTFEKESIWSQF